MDDRDRPANELLYDTEAALRLVDKALDEICGASEGHAETLPGDPPATAASGQPAAVLALVRQPKPTTHAPRPALAAELTDILEDIRLGRALLDRARSRRPSSYTGHGAGAACSPIGNQYLDGAAHLLGDLEQRVARLAEMLKARE